MTIQHYNDCIPLTPTNQKTKKTRNRQPLGLPFPSEVKMLMERFQLTLEALLSDEFFDKIKHTEETRTPSAKSEEEKMCFVFVPVREDDSGIFCFELLILDHKRHSFPVVQYLCFRSLMLSIFLFCSSLIGKICPAATSSCHEENQKRNNLIAAGLKKFRAPRPQLVELPWLQKLSDTL